MRALPASVGLAYVDERTPQLAVAVSPIHQGKGYGRALMIAALRAAQQAGYSSVSLTVHPRNPAISLYSSVGFEKVGVRSGYDLMVAPLVPNT
jgi:GNAT superfamily N-acetyltransferase